MGVWKRPTPPMPIFHGCPLWEPQSVPATSQGCCTPGFSRSPNSLNPPWRILGRTFSYPSSPKLSASPWRKQLTSWFQFWQSFQVKIQESLFILFRCWTPPGTVIFKVRGMTLLWLHWAAPSCSVPKISVCGNSSFWSGHGPPASPWWQNQLSCSISSSKVAIVPRVLWWASLTLVRPLSVEVSLLPLLGVLLLGGWRSVRPGFSIIHGGSHPFHPRQSSREDTTSAVSSSIHSGSPRGDPGSLQSLYPKLLPTGLRSYKLDGRDIHLWGPTLCWQPQQVMHSTSFSPCSAVCWKISCRMTGQWGLSIFHPGYPSRNISTSMWHSICLTDRPSVFACSFFYKGLIAFVPIC